MNEDNDITTRGANFDLGNDLHMNGREAIAYLDQLKPRFLSRGKNKLYDYIYIEFRIRFLSPVHYFYHNHWV